MLHSIDLRRQSGVSHQSLGSAVSIGTTFGWHNRYTHVFAQVEMRGRRCAAPPMSGVSDGVPSITTVGPRHAGSTPTRHASGAAADAQAAQETRLRAEITGH